MKIEENIKGRRILAIDYGRKRVGLATCDELHISVSPIGFRLLQEKSFWAELLETVKELDPVIIVLGMPYRTDGEVTNVMKEIENFAKALKSKTGLNVYFQDEAFSSVKAHEIMLSNSKKKQRSKKGTADKIAAAVILKEFLEANSY